MNFDPAEFDSDHIPKHELILDINENALLLINALRIQRESDIERTILRFDINDSEFNVPNFISRTIDSDSVLEEIIVDAEVNRLTNAAEVIIRAETSGAQNLLLHISTGESTENGPASSILIDDDEMPCLDPVTHPELNRFLASLFIKNKLGDYSAFDKMDLSDPAITHRLIEALKETADETITDETYFLGKTLSMNTDSVRYTEHDGTIHSATVCIEHHAQASEVEINFSGKMMPMELEEETADPEFLMQELEGIRSYKQDVNGETTRISSNNDFLIVVRDFLLSKRDTVFTAPAELLGDTDVDVVDTTLEINLEDRKS